MTGVRGTGHDLPLPGSSLISPWALMTSGRCSDRRRDVVLEAWDVGHRVVVRRRVGTGGQGRLLYTDLLGDLVAIDDQRLTLRADDGTEHSVELTEVAAGKRIPPRPVRYSEMA